MEGALMQLDCYLWKPYWNWNFKHFRDSNQFLSYSCMKGERLKGERDTKQEGIDNNKGHTEAILNERDRQIG